MSSAAVVGVTAAAMVAFAANSVLTRAALDADHADGATFAAVRLTSGAAFLLLLVAFGRGRTAARSALAGRAWLSAAALFTYAAGFSYAYLTLSAGTGALILFGVVQATILGWALVRGERLHALAWLGLSLAVGGLIYLVGPGVSAPDPLGAALMALAGLAWAVYTMRGRGGRDPVLATTANFSYSVPFAVLLLAVALVAGAARMDAVGLALAVTSGAIASALGYVLWYAALPHLSRTTAGIVQLTPAPLAAVGGLLLVGEAITARFVIASILILGGVALAVAPRASARTRT